MKSLFALLMLALLASNAAAFENDVPLDDPALEQRAHALSKEFRCLVCQNQSIFDSDAELARDLRLIVRERLVAGDSDDEIVAYLVARYGDFVLLKPPVKPVTYVLWFGPGVLALLALIGGWVFLRRLRKQTQPAQALSADERARLNALLDDEPAR